MSPYFDKKQLVYYYTMPRSGTNIVYGSLALKFKSKDYDIIKWDKVYPNYEQFDESKTLDRINPTKNTFLASHGDVSDNLIDYLVDNYEIELYTIQRKNLYTWFLTSIFNYFFFNTLLTNQPKVVFNQTDADSLYDKMSFPTKLITITYQHMIPQIEYYIRYLTIKSKLIKYSVSHNELYYEDLVTNPAEYLQQFNIVFSAETASVKFRKPDYKDIFSNVDQAEDMWETLLNKRLKICGIAK